MRAKMMVMGVDVDHPGQETLKFSAVGGTKVEAEGYPEDGEDEDNTFAKWSPMGELSLTVCNPNLIGKFKAGEKYYLDFTRAES